MYFCRYMRHRNDAKNKVQTVRKVRGGCHRSTEVEIGGNEDVTTKLVELKARLQVRESTPHLILILHYDANLCTNLCTIVSEKAIIVV